jgi:ATP-dependent Clp protease ATP-binding subunit ClpX
MNYTAEEGESVDSILLVGPTGTGKTETVRAACDYLCIPFFEANAANLVPQGIRGMSIEDVVIGLYELAGHDIKLAQRGLVFLDEYDKVNASDLDIKQAVKQILLSFNDGGKIQIRDEMYDLTFDSKMTNKVYAGVFDRISEKVKTVGFGTNNEVPLLGSDEDIRQKIIDKKYFSLEEISRISTILGYDELSRDVKKQILLYSKLSVFAKKRERYRRQFGIELQATDDYIEAILDSISNSASGMRSVNNYVKKSIDNAERTLLENERKGYKKLILTKDTVSDPKKFDMTK